MQWLALGVLYTVAYAVFGWTLRDQPTTLSSFRAAALCIPPLTAAAVIVFRRQTWSGCQWLFWSTIALGLVMSAIGLTGWAADELIFHHATWLARSEEHTSELQSRRDLVCRLLLEKKKKKHQCTKLTARTGRDCTVV